MAPGGRRRSTARRPSASSAPRSWSTGAAASPGPGTTCGPTDMRPRCWKRCKRSTEEHRTSTLVPRAPPCRPAADGAPAQLGAVGGAAPAGTTLRHDVAEVRTTAPEQDTERPAQMSVQAPHLRIRQRAGRAPRDQAGAPQRLVGDEVAYPRDARLVHESSLQGGGAAGQLVAKLRQGDGERVRTESAFVRVEAHAAEQARVSHHHAPAVAEAKGETVPGGVG